jgi:hypothetical protein
VNGAFKDVLKEGGSELTETNLMQMDEKKWDDIKRRENIVFYSFLALAQVASYTATAALV